MLLKTNNKYLLVQIVCMFWLIAKVMSFSLWMNDRTFPLIAVHPLFQNSNQNFHIVIYAGSLLLLSTTLFFKPKKKLLLVLLVLEIVACLSDYTRWQPWQFMYCSMLFIFIICFNDTKKAFQWVGVILVSTYIYSGLHKLNSHFIDNMWVESILKDFLNLSSTTIIKFKLTKIGLLLPIIETLAGVGLLSKFWQKKAAYMLILMHLLLLLILGPIGLNYNKIVWPWNIAMICLLYLIFIKQSTMVFNFNLLLSPSLMLIAFLWIIMPLCSFWGKWPHYLSNDLYSAKAMGMQLTIKHKNLSNNPLVAFSNGVHKEDSTITVNIQHWAMQELGTPQFPEWFYYQKMATLLKATYQNHIHFSILNSPYKDSLNNILNNK